MSDIKRSYLNYKFSGAYSGLTGFMKNRKKWKDKEAVENELRKLNSYTLHKDVRKKFKRRPIILHFSNDVWTADLKQLPKKVAAANLKKRYVLIVVDAFSKQMHAEMIKDKTSDSMIAAFKKIMATAGAKPHFLFTDKGTEFLSKAFTDFLTENRIKRYGIYSHIKVSLASFTSFSLAGINYILFLIGQQ